MARRDEIEAIMIEDGNQSPPGQGGVQGWVEANRAKIWIWGIGGLALAGVGCMMLVVVILILRK